MLDFDGVLFDDERFKRDYWRVFRHAGIPHRAHQRAYAESKKRHVGGYRHDLHLALLSRDFPKLNVSRLERNIWRLLASSKKYLYRETRPFLRHWRARRMPLVLVSSGNAFQKEKVRASRLAPFFQSVAVTDTVDKVAPIGTLIKRFNPPRAVFIDDKKSFVDAVKSRFPDILVLQMIRRKDQEQSAHADAVVSNLAAARRVIAQRILRT